MEFQNSADFPCVSLYFSYRNIEDNIEIPLTNLEKKEFPTNYARSVLWHVVYFLLTWSKFISL